MRTEDEMKLILTAMGYKVTIYRQEDYPVQLMNDRLQTGGRFWSIRHAYKVVLSEELQSLEETRINKNKHQQSY